MVYRMTSGVILDCYARCNACVGTWTLRVCGQKNWCTGARVTLVQDSPLGEGLPSTFATTHMPLVDDNTSFQQLGLSRSENIELYSN